jgi:recombination protein RecR
LSDFPPSLERLLNELGKLPGVGPRSALRIAFNLLKQPVERSQALSQAVLDARSRLKPCRECFNLTEGNLCRICEAPNREMGTILVVEDASDVAVFERARDFRGLYHVLGGTLSPLEGRGPEALTLEALVSRVKRHPEVKEIVVATDPTVEGDSTALYLQQLLKGNPVKVTRLARGVPSGGDIDYTDETTLLKAFENRREF